MRPAAGPELPLRSTPGPSTGLKAPRSSGEIAARPDLSRWEELAIGNARALAESRIHWLGQPLTVLRKSARAELLARSHQFTSELDAVIAESNPESAAASSAEDRPELAVKPPSALWLVTGHQPDLFHPGVLAKQLFVGLAAGESNAARRNKRDDPPAIFGLNLIVDSDLPAGHALTIPTGSPEQLELTAVPWDEPAHNDHPWETATLARPDFLLSLGSRLKSLRAQGVAACGPDVWPVASAAVAGRPASAWFAFTAIRRRVLQQMHVRALAECPLSGLTETSAFAWFLLEIVRRLPEFHAAHNQATKAYRRRNRIRSDAHPVPDLTTVGDWWEAPFWLLDRVTGRRQHVFARVVDHELWLTADPQRIDSVGSTGSAADLPLIRLPWPDEPFSASVDPASHTVEQDVSLSASEVDWSGSVEAVVALQRGRRWAIRTRALTTTMFARLAVADLFVHGIGGAKYDELTDQIIARLWHTDPPPFLTLTATSHLPLAMPHGAGSTSGSTGPLVAGDQAKELAPPTNEDLRRRRGQLQQLRERWQFNPENWFQGTEDLLARRLIAEKQRLLEEFEVTRSVPRAQRATLRERNRGRYRRLAEINAALQALMSHVDGDLATEWARLEQALQQQRLRTNREFSFVLFDLQSLGQLSQHLQHAMRN